MLQACSESPIISLVDQRVLSINILENGERLVDLKNQTEILFGPSPEIPDNNDYTKVRYTVYQKLLQAQKTLPNNLRFCLYEGYRSLNLQKKLFNDRYEVIKNKNPHWKHEQLFYETIKLVSPLINLDGSHNIPPHSTGGAIDIYLVDIEGNIIDMGIKVAEWMQDIDGSLSVMDSTKISIGAKEYRKIMSKALSSMGFINYPGEYWHWSYGDKYWAYHSNPQIALYDSVKEQ